MKLLLASKEKFLLNKGYSLLGIPKDQLKIGIINTALTFVQDEEYLKYMKEYNELMKSSGIDFKELDIDGKTEAEILNFFADRNVIQVNGGNPFFLLKKIRETKFDVILKELLEKRLCYVGCSSGSFIMTPTIEIGGWKEGRNRFGVEDMAALNYVPFLIKCHYVDEDREKILEKLKTMSYPLRVIRDNQGILVEDGKYTFIGDGEEVVIN